MIDIGRNEEICREMDKLANDDHTHRITEEEIRVYRNNWWMFEHSEFRHDARKASNLISNKPSQPCDSSRTRRIQLATKSGKALPHPGGTGKNPGGILHLSITATMDPTLIDRGNLMDGDWANYSRYDSQNLFGAELQFTIRLQPTTVHSHRRGV